MKKIIATINCGNTHCGCCHEQVETGINTAFCMLFDSMLRVDGDNYIRCDGCSRAEVKAAVWTEGEQGS